MFRGFVNIWNYFSENVTALRMRDNCFALEREPSDVFLVVADVIRYILEAPLGDEAEPSCRVALALHLVALAVLHHLALALAKFAQHLNINTIFPEFLFHRRLIICCDLVHVVFIDENALQADAASQFMILCL